MMIIAMIIGILSCFFLGTINLKFYVKLKHKGNLYVSIFDFAVAIFMIIILIIYF